MYYLDKEKTQPLGSALAWAVRHRYSATFTPIASPESGADYDRNYALYAQLVEGGEWVRVWGWSRRRTGAPRKEGAVSQRTLQRRAKEASDSATL